MSLTPQAEGARPVIQTLGTVLHRPGKGKLSAGSLNPHSINQVPIVKPRHGPRLNHLEATGQVPALIPRESSLFFCHRARGRAHFGICVTRDSCHLFTICSLYYVVSEPEYRVEPSEVTADIPPWRPAEMALPRDSDQGGREAAADPVPSVPV